MPDSVDNLGDSTPTPAEATPPANGADSTSSARKGPRNGFESRIAELVQQKHEINRTWQAKYDDLLSSHDQTERRLAEIESKLGKGTSQGAKSPIFRGFDQMSQEDIDQVMAQGPGDNPAFYASVQQEDKRRYGEELLNRAKQQTSEANRDLLKQQKAWNEIKSRFGPDLDNPQSELRQTAERYMAQLRREEGDRVLQDMNAQYRCVAAAYHDLHAHDAEELQSQRREVDRLKQTQAMGTGVKSAMRLNDKVEEALKKARQAPNAVASKQAIGEGLRALEIVQGTREP